jgi:phenylacetate-coenzyme A ligase PaaK-like adenylate-forming protein
MIMPGLNETVLRRLLICRGDESDLALVQYLREARIALLHGKPGVLARLVELDRAIGAGAHIRPAHVVCSGENLYADDRAGLESWFGCRILEAYVASEGGMMAVECESKNGMHVLADQLVVEVADDNDGTRPCGSGELLITNAMNWRHAFIRYRIGDRATVIDEGCPCGHVGQTIIALPGRERASYTIDGQIVAATDIANAVGLVGASVKQYQVAPGPGNTIVVSWILAPWATSRETEDALAASLRARIPSAGFELRRVSEITTPGGKLRRFA